MKKNSLIALCLTFFFGLPIINAQELLEILDQESPQNPIYTQATFKANRILIGQSVETRKKGILEFNVHTKFWNIPNSQTQAFAADRVNARFGIDYAFTDRFSAGIGAGTFDGTFNAVGKYRLVRQRQDNNKSPFAVTLVQSASYLTRSFNHVILPEDSSERFSYTSQVLLARKFTPNFSLQIAPSFVHRTSQQFPEDDNNHFALGFGARYKLGNHVSIASEYYYVANRVRGIKGFSPFALGVNWEVSDLILQFSMTNARSFDESTFITLNALNFNFNNGNLHIGVSATYVFHLNQNRKKKKK